jgi:mRNA interferase MazF
MALNLNRGEMYWINLDPTVGSEIRKKRPCVIIGASPINRARRTVIVVPLSSAGKPQPPLTIPVACMGRDVVAVCDQIRAVDKSRFIERIGPLSKSDLMELEKGLQQVLAL